VRGNAGKRLALGVSKVNVFHGSATAHVSKGPARHPRASRFYGFVDPTCGPFRKRCGNVAFFGALGEGDAGAKTPE